MSEGRKLAGVTERKGENRTQCHRGHRREDCRGGCRECRHGFTASTLAVNEGDGASIKRELLVIRQTLRGGAELK